MKYIVILPGGGLKGMIQATIIKERYLVNMWPKQVDLYVTTSVGAINGSALASGVNPLDLYTNWPDLARKAFKRERLWAPIYSRENVMNEWKKMVKTNKMGELPTKLMISSVDLTEMKQHFFKSWEDTEMDLDTAVMRSFAAPYYFGTMPDKVSRKVWADGGIADANFPITEAIMEMLALGWHNESVTFIVVGTGYVDINEPFDDVAKDGAIEQILSYMRPKEGGLARLLSRQDQIGQLQFLAKKFPRIHYEYWDIVIPDDMDGMDKLDSINAYKVFGQIAARQPIISI